MGALLAEAFHSFSFAHAVALAWTLSILVAVLAIGLSTSDHRRLDLVLTGLAVLVNVGSIVYFLLPSQLSWTKSLPLQLCDVAGLVTPVALGLGERKGFRWARSLVYFWGIGLCSQAFFTPTLTVGFPLPEYWQFWLLHLTIVGAAIYDVVVRGYRPGVRDWGVAVAVSVVWFAGMFGVDFLLDRLGVAGANYGFAGQTLPDRPTILDGLGPWPERVWLIALIGFGAITLAYVLWPIAGVFWGRTQKAEQDVKVI